jgi:hypothetical protein
MLSIKTFKCDCCAYVSKQSNNLHRHKKSKHNSISKEEEVLSLLRELNEKEKRLNLLKIASPS